MSMFELLIKCPKCKSVTTIIGGDANPIIYVCSGCGKGVVMHDTTLYTISTKVLSDLMRKYNVIECGQVISSKISDYAKDLITDEKMEDLHRALTQSKDVNDIISKL